MNSCQFEADIIGRFDWIVLVPHAIQVIEDILARAGGGARVAASLDEHLFELHEHVGVEASETQHGDDGGDRGRRTALLLETLLRDVEGLGDEGAELVVNHPAHGGQGLRVDAQHVHGVLESRLPPRVR